MSVTLGNPIIITSGTVNTLITNENIKVKKLILTAPQTVTSSLLIKKLNASGQVYMNVAVQTSGQIIQIDNVDMWWNAPYIECMPSGTLAIYCH